MCVVCVLGVRAWCVAVVHNERSAFYRERFLKLYPVRRSNDTRKINHESHAHSRLISAPASGVTAISSANH